MPIIIRGRRACQIILKQGHVEKNKHRFQEIINVNWIALLYTDKVTLTRYTNCHY